MSGDGGGACTFHPKSNVFVRHRCILSGHNVLCNVLQNNGLCILSGHIVFCQVTMYYEQRIMYYATFYNNYFVRHRCILSGHNVFCQVTMYFVRSQCIMQYNIIVKLYLGKRILLNNIVFWQATA